MAINNRGLYGQPILPYVDNRSYAGVDVFIDLTFLDHTGTPVQPSSLTYRLDDISNDTSIIPLTTLTPSGPFFTLQIPGSVLQMTYPFQGSQLCQLITTATLLDSVTGKTSTAISVSMIELLAIQTPS